MRRDIEGLIEELDLHDEVRGKVLEDPEHAQHRAEQRVTALVDVVLATAVPKMTAALEKARAAYTQAHAALFYLQGLGGDDKAIERTLHMPVYADDPRRHPAALAWAAAREALKNDPESPLPT
jgi:uncharacterized caspase-like protein